jgi:YD repeat-containing protein
MRPILLLLPFAAVSLWGQPGAIDCNQPADVTFTPTSPQANLQFRGSQGEAVYFRVVQVSGVSAVSVQPRIVDQFNNATATVRPRTSTATGATPGDLAAQGFEVDLFTDSLFTLQLQSANAATAGLHVVMVRLNRPCATTKKLTCGRSIAGSISLPPVVNGALALPPFPGQMDTYQLDVQSGDKISFRLVRVPVSGVIFGNTYFPFVVYGPDGHALNVDPKTNRLNFDTAPTVVNDRLDLTVNLAGTLTVMVFEPTGVLGGNYYISATKLNGGCGGPALSCGGIQDSQITTPLTFGSYSLQASQGDVWQFRVARSDNFGSFVPFVEVYDAQGNRVGTAGPVSPSGHAAAANVIRIPATGSYFVMVSGPLDGSTGGYSLSTVRLNNTPCAEQALGCSSIVDGSTNGLLRTHVYSLQANAGDNYLIRLLQNNPTALFRPRIDVYDSTGADLQFVNTGDLARQNFTVPADGSYTVLVTDSYDSSQSGSYSFSLLRLNRPCDAGTLSCGAPAPGNLARSLSSGVYTYTAAAAESFSVRMLPTGGVLPAIEVYDPQGNLTGQALTGTFAGTDVVAPAAGSYTIVALDSSKSPGTGSFTIDLLRTRNACAQPLLQGQTGSGVVSAAEPFVGYTFSASTGDTLALRSASSTPGFSAQMEIYDPNGSRLDGSVFGLTRKALASGVYTVIVVAAAPRTAGGYALAWQLLNNPAGATPLACGATASGSLAGAGQFRYYTVAADAGDTMRMIFTKTSDNFAPQIELFDASGSRLAANSDVTTKATAGGNYLALVSPSTTAVETGSYALSYQRPNNPCTPVALTCGQTTLRPVNLPGQLDTLTFNGTGGDLTTIRLATRSGNYSPFVEMYNAKGAQLSTSSNGQLRSVLAADGVYTLLVRDRGATNLGSYRVSLQDDTNNCPVTDTEAPAVTLLKPTGGEVLPGGAGFRIQWQSDDNVGVTSHDIALSTDGGKTFPTAVAVGLGGNQQVYDWPVPLDIAPTRTAVIRVTATDAAGNAQSAASDLLTVIGSGFAPNATAQYTYDGLNRLTQATLGDGRTIQYTWDAAGNLVQITVSGQ